MVNFKENNINITSLKNVEDTEIIRENFKGFKIKDFIFINNKTICRVSEAYWTQENVNKILIIHISSTTKLSMCS